MIILKKYYISLLFLILINVITISAADGDITLAELNILSTSSSVVGEQSTYELRIVAPRNMEIGSIVSLDFNNCQILAHQSILEQCTFIIEDTGSQEQFTDCTCTSNICEITTKTYIYQDYLFLIKMGKITNAPYVRSQQNIILTIKYPSLYADSQLALEMAQEVLTPGQISSSSIIQQSFKVGYTNTYTFTFNPTNQIPLDGKIKFSLPDEVNLPQIDNIDVQPTAKINIYNNGLVTTSVESPVVSKQIFIYGFATPVNIQSGQNIVVEISGLQNPISITTSQSFIIQTVSKDNFVIDIIDSGITVQSTDPGDITGISAYITGPTTNSEINKESTFTIKALPAQPFFSGGKFEVVFPSEFSINPTTFGCSRKTGLTITDGTNTSKCAFIGKTVYTTNMEFASTNNKFIWITFDGIKLPSNTKQTGVFTIKTYDSSSNVICINTENVTFTALPGTITMTEQTRTVTQVNYNTQLIFDFTLTNPILQNSYLNFKISKDQVITNGNSIVCQKIIGGSLEVNQPCTLKSTETDYYLLETLEWCSQSSSSCPSNQFLQFKITDGFKNTQYIIENNIFPIEIQSLTPDNDGTLYDKIDTVQLDPLLDPLPLTDIQFVRSGSNQVGGISKYTITYTQSEYIQQNSGKLIIYFPLHTVNKQYTQDIVCKVNSEVKTCITNLYTSDNLTEQSIKNIEILDICSSTACQSMSGQFVIEIENTRNPLSNYPIPYTIGVEQLKSDYQYFGIQSFTMTNLVIGFGQALQLTGYQNDILLNNSVINVLKSDDTIGMLSQYTFQIPLSIEFLKSNYNSKLEIQLPSQIVIDTNNSLCTVRIGSAVIVCEIISNSLLKITHDKTGEFVSNNLSLTIVITNVRNPQTSQITDDIIIKSYNIQNTYISQQWNYGIQSIKKKILENINVTRDITEINQSTKVTLQFTHYNPLLDNSQIQITIPNDQLQFDSSISSQLIIKSESTQTDIPFIVDTDVSDNQDYISFILIDSVQCPCLGNTHNLSYTIEGGKNPSVARPPMNSIQITTMDKNGYFMEEKLSDFFILPIPSAGQLIINSFTSNNKITGFDTVELSIDTTINNDIPQNGKFIIFFPENMYFESLSQSLVVKQNNQVKNTVNIQTKQNNFENYIFSLTIQICETGVCTAGSNLIIQITNLRNKPSVQQIPNDIILSTSDFDSYLIDQEQQSTQNLIPDTPKNIQGITITRDQDIVSQNTNIQIQYNTELALPENSQIEITFPLSEIIVQNISECFNQLSQQQNCDINEVLNKITIKNQCSSSYCLLNTNFQLEIRNLQNQSYLPISYTQQKLDIQILNENNELIQKNNADFAISPILNMWEISNFDFKFDSLQVGKQNDFQMVFTTQGQISDDSILEIQFSGDQSLRKGMDTQNVEFYVNNNQIQNNLLQITYNYENNQNYSYIQSLNIQGINQDINNKITNGSTIKIIMKNITNELYEKQFNSQISIQFYKNNQKQQQHSITTIQANTIQSYYFQAIEIDSDILQINRLDSEYLSENTDIQFNYILPSPLPQGSEIRFKLPKQQIILPNTVSCTNNINCQVILTDIDYFYLQIMQDFCSNTCETNYVLNFKIQGCSNPDTKKMSQQNQVELDTKLTNKKIHQTQSISLIPKLKINNDNLLIKQIQRSSSVIQEVNTLKIDIVLNNDNNLINLTSITSFFVISLPDMLIYESLSSLEFYVNGVEFTSDIINTETEYDLFNNKYYKKLVIAQICNQIDCTRQQNLFTIELKKIKNPYLVQINSNKDDNIVFAITDSNYYGLLEDSYNLNSILPELSMTTSIISLQQFTRSTQVLTSQDVEIQLNFKILQPLLPKSYIDIYLPTVQVQQQSQQIQCYISSSLVDCDTNIDNNIIIIRIQENCSINDSTNCPVNTIFNIKLTKLQNPAFQTHKTDDNSAQIQLIYEHSLYKIFKQAYLDSNMFLSPDLDAINLNTFSVTRAQQTASSITDLDFYFQLPSTTLPSDMNIVLNFPHQFNIYNSSTCTNGQNNEQIDCQFTKITSSQIQYIDSITISCQKQTDNICQPDSIVLIKISSQNQVHTKDLRQIENLFSLHLRKNDLELAHGYYSTINLQQITPGTINLESFQSSSLLIGQNNIIFDISITLSSYLLTQEEQGSLTLTIPSKLVQTNGENIKCQVSNPSIQFFYICYVLSDQNQIIIIKEQTTLNYQLNEQLDIQITGLSNPQDSRQLTGFSLFTQGQIDEQLVQFDENLHLMTYTADVLGNLSATVTRSNSNIFENTEVIFEISQNQNPLFDSNYKIAIDILNSYQFIFSNTQNLQCLDGNNGNTIISCFKNSDNLIIIEDLCDSGCPQNSNFNIIISQGLQNTPYFKTNFEENESLGVYTVIQENLKYYKIDGTFTNLLAQPLIQKNEFTSFVINQENNLSMEVNTFNISFDSVQILAQQLIDNSYKLRFNFKFPQNTVIFESLKGDYLQCQIDSNILVNNQYCLYNEILRSVYLSLNYNNISNYYQVSIQGLRNYYYEFDNNQQYEFTLQVEDQNQTFQNVYIKSFTKKDYFLDIIPSNFDQIQLFSDSPFKNTVAQFQYQFILKHDLPQNQNLEIHIEYSNNSNSYYHILDDNKQQILDNNNILSTNNHNNNILIATTNQDIKKGYHNLTIGNIKFLNVYTLSFNMKIKYNNRVIVQNSQNINLVISTQQDCIDTLQNCQSCDISQNICLKCENPSEFPFYDQNTNTCIKQCQDNQYWDQPKLKCINCHVSCQQCYGGLAENCTMCQQDYIFLGGLCVQIPQCPENSFLNDQNQCQQKDETLCINDCLLCGVSLDFCLNCPVNKVLDLEQGKCLDRCIDGQYFNQENQKCQNCDEQCSLCTGQSDNCLQCSDVYNEIENQILLEGKCVQQCPSGSFKDGQQCTQCLENCEICDNIDTCTQCKDQQYYDTQNNICVEQCNNDTQIQDEINKKCIKACDNKDEILSQEGNCVKNCPIGQEKPNQNSKQCDYIVCDIQSCSLCANNKSCYLCLDNKIKNEDGQCIDTCPEEEYYYENTTKSCKKCVVQNCQDCKNDFDKCQLCKTGYLYNQDTNICELFALEEKQFGAITISMIILGFIGIFYLVLSIILKGKNQKLIEIITAIYSISGILSVFTSILLGIALFNVGNNLQFNSSITLFIIQISIALNFNQGDFLILLKNTKNLYEELEKPKIKSHIKIMSFLSYFGGITAFNMKDSNLLGLQNRNLTGCKMLQKSLKSSNKWSLFINLVQLGLNGSIFGSEDLIYGEVLNSTLISCIYILANIVSFTILQIFNRKNNKNKSKDNQNNKKSSSENIVSKNNVQENSDNSSDSEDSDQKIDNNNQNKNKEVNNTSKNNFQNNNSQSQQIQIN